MWHRLLRILRAKWSWYFRGGRQRWEADDRLEADVVVTAAEAPGNPLGYTREFGRIPFRADLFGAAATEASGRGTGSGGSLDTVLRVLMYGDPRFAGWQVERGTGLYSIRYEEAVELSMHTFVAGVDNLMGTALKEALRRCLDRVAKAADAPCYVCATYQNMGFLSDRLATHLQVAAMARPMLCHHISEYQVQPSGTAAPVVMASEYKSGS